MQTANRYVFSTENIIFAYLLAVTAAALTMTLILFTHIINFKDLLQWLNKSTWHAPHAEIMHLLRALSGVLFGAWITAFIAALVPFVMGIVMADRFMLYRWYYFVGGGVLTALSFCLIILCIMQMDNYGDVQKVSFSESLIRSLPFALPNLLSGVTAGAACWLYLRRKSTVRNTDTFEPEYMFP